MHSLRLSTDPALHVRISGAPSGAVSAAGAPRPVILVHGMGGDHSTWRGLARGLRADGRPVISFDLRGHGRSARSADYGLNAFRDDLAAVVDELDAPSVDLVGHSLGAHTALRFAMDRPALVDRLVLEEVPPMPRDEADLAERIVAGSSLGETVRGLIATVRNPGPLIRFDRAIGAQVGAAFETADPGWWHRLSAVTATTLIISGGDRSFLPPRHLRTVGDTLPDADFEIIDAGHSVHRDKAAAFDHRVRGFLRRPQGAEPMIAPD